MMFEKNPMIKSYAYTHGWKYQSAYTFKIYTACLQLMRFSNKFVYTEKGAALGQYHGYWDLVSSGQQVVICHDTNYKGKVMFLSFV